MEKSDLVYLCTVIGNPCGIPIRVFEGNEQTFYYSLVRLSKNPMTLYRDAIWRIQNHVGYLVTTHFHYYGIGKKISVGRK